MHTASCDIVIIRLDYTNLGNPYMHMSSFISQVTSRRGTPEVHRPTHFIVVVADALALNWRHAINIHHVEIVTTNKTVSKRSKFRQSVDSFATGHIVILRWYPQPTTKLTETR